MSLHAPKRNEVGQSARWLLERQWELMMGRTSAWEQD